MLVLCTSPPRLTLKKVKEIYKKLSIFSIVRENQIGAITGENGSPETSSILKDTFIC